MVFSVLFEVAPHASKWDAYLAAAKSLKPELEKIRGFVDNIRYSSLTRDGTILSLSNWADEKALVRWRTTFKHHLVQEKGRTEILEDYHLRVGEVIKDIRGKIGKGVEEIGQRLDETEVGSGTTIVLVDAKRDKAWIDDRRSKPEEVAAWLGLDVKAEKSKGLLAWDVFDAVLSPGDAILLATWKDRNAASGFEKTVGLPEGSRFRVVRVIREYGKYDRREAPQYYPDAAGRETIHV